MKKILLITLTAITMFSCQKDDTLRYNNITMANIKNQSIVSDQGNVFDIAESPVQIDLSELEDKRFLIICDVLQETAEKRYDIRLNGLYPVLTKDVEVASGITKPDLEVEDAINIRELWYGGGYLNMLIEIVQKNGSDKEHLITLVHDDNAEGYTFILRHNGYGEVPSKEDLRYTNSTGYVSFPISSVIDGDEATITLKWKSHKFYPDGSFSLLESDVIKRDFKWKRAGYEHGLTSAGQSMSFRAR